MPALSIQVDLSCLSLLSHQTLKGHMNIVRALSFQADGRHFYIVIGGEIDSKFRTPIGFAVRHTSAPAGNSDENPDFDFKKIAKARLETGKYRFEIPVGTSPSGSFQYDGWQKIELARKIIAWLESEGVILRPGSIADLIRRGTFFLKVAGEVDDLARFQESKKVVAWAASAREALERLNEEDTRYQTLESLVNSLTPTGAVV